MLAIMAQSGGGVANLCEGRGLTRRSALSGGVTGTSASDETLAKRWPLSFCPEVVPSTTAHWNKLEQALKVTNNMRMASHSDMAEKEPMSRSSSKQCCLRSRPEQAMLMAGPMGLKPSAFSGKPSPSGQEPGQYGASGVFQLTLPQVTGGGHVYCCL